MQSNFLAATDLRRRYGFASVCLLAALILAWQSFRAGNHLETTAHVEGSQAEQVEQQLALQFHSSFTHRAILVIQGIASPQSKEGEAALREIVTALRKDPGVAGTFCYLDWNDAIFLGEGGGTFIILGLSGDGAQVDASIPRLRQRTQALSDQMRARFAGLKFEMTGETPLNFDLRKVSSDDVRIAESRVLPVVLVLLLATFASLIAALLPLAVGLLAMLMTLGAAALLGRWWHLSILIQNIATMLGLGLGIDYALLMVSRFREAVAAGETPSTAAHTAARFAGRTLLVSASTVAIGFAALLTVPISDVRSIGAAGILVAGACMLLANWILPVMLYLLGTRIEAGRLAVLRWANPNSFRAQERWRAWTRFVIARPWMALLLAASPLVFLASQMSQLTVGLPRIDWLPRGAESVRALHSLEKMRRMGIVEALPVILELPPGSEVTTYPGFTATRLLAADLGADRRADRVISLPGLLGRGFGPSFLPLLPAETRRNFLRQDGRATLLEVLPAVGASQSDLGHWVRELREKNTDTLSGVAGATIRVGGIDAFNDEYDGTVKRQLPRVMAVIVGGTLLALLAGFQSIAVAVKAIALNLLSVGAALGALVLVFQEGHGSALFGLEGGTGTVFSLVPIVTFAVVFGLSMDYEVFLVARVLEARRSGFSETDAIAEGVAKTGGLITSAGAIMVVVFVGFAFGNVLVVKMLGFALAVAVLIDVTIVRMIIGPALLRVCGAWNWWPWGLAPHPQRKRHQLY
jgi:putative drug exporter of the RND superfamily